MSHKSEAEWAFKSENVGDWNFWILLQIIFKRRSFTWQIFQRNLFDCIRQRSTVQGILF